MSPDTNLTAEGDLDQQGGTLVTNSVLKPQEQLQMEVVGRFPVTIWGFLSIEQLPPGTLSAHMILCSPLHSLT